MKIETVCRPNCPSVDEDGKLPNINKEYVNNYTFPHPSTHIHHSITLRVPVPLFYFLLSPFFPLPPAFCLLRFPVFLLPFPIFLLPFHVFLLPFPVFLLPFPVFLLFLFCRRSLSMRLQFVQVCSACAYNLYP